MRPTQAGIGYFALTCAITICAAAMLSGCAATRNTPPAKAPAASHAPTPKTTPTADAAADALFTISAKVRSSSGATIDIRLIAHPPLAADDSAAKAAAAEFLKECGSSGQGTPITENSMVADQGILLQFDLSSSTSGENFVSPLNLYLGGTSRATTASGTGIIAPPAANGCYGLYSWSKSGAVHAITEFENDDASEDLTQWRYGIYGFAVQEGANATIEGCTIKLSAQALNAGLKDVPGWVASDTSGTTCATGYIGE
jgi:hypothetical protein